MRQNNNLWLWGYVLKQVPGNMMFVDLPTLCSLETGADYLGADNVVFMDSTTDRNNLNDDIFQHVAKFKKVICGLQHGHYAETARMVSEFAAAHPNVTGAIIDDFRCLGGPSEGMTVEQLREIRQALDSVTPGLKLYLVCYFGRFEAHALEQFRDLFDGINVWCWDSSTHFWQVEYEYTILKLRHQFPGKEILQGQFLHAWGDGMAWHGSQPQPMDQLELQTEKIANAFRDRNLEGWVVLQNGYFSYPNHRRQVQFLKDYFEWLFGTWTSRD